MPSSLNKTVKSKIKINKISAKDTYNIRLAVLRKGLTIDDCVFDGDNNPNTFHLGLYYNNILTGIASYMVNNSKTFNKEKQLQLRGMAILDEFQGLGLGKHILKEAERISQEKQIELIWFNAREIAVPFYNRNNYTTIGDYFNIKGVGKHIIMFKELPNN